MTFHVLFTESEFWTRAVEARPNLAEIRKRIDRLVADGVPETAKLAMEHDPNYLHDNFGFVTSEDYSQIPNGQLVERFVDAHNPEERAALRREIEDRLG